MPKLLVLRRMGLDRAREVTNSAAATSAGRRVANISLASLVPEMKRWMDGNERRWCQIAAADGFFPFSF